MLEHLSKYCGLRIILNYNNYYVNSFLNFLKTTNCFLTKEVEIRKNHHQK